MTTISHKALSTSPIKNSIQQKRSIFFIAVIIVIVLIIVIVIVSLLGKDAGKNEDEPKPKLSQTLQDAMRQNCIEYKFPGGGSSYFIDPMKLPITLNIKNIYIKNQAKKGMLTCLLGDVDQQNGYISFSYVMGTASSVAYIYDKNSVEIGHGGIVSLASYGSIIEETPEYIISAYLVFSFDEGENWIGNIPVNLRVVRILEFSEGEKIYISTDFVALDRTSTQLVQILGEFGSEYVDSGKIIEAQDKIVKEFFQFQIPESSSQSQAMGRAYSFINAFDY